MLTFHSRAESVGEMPAFDQETVKNEPMLFNAGLQFSACNGGPITKAFIACLPWDFLQEMNAVIDTRVHMLMPGWFPCIPGWHHDDVPRNTVDGQPNYVDPPYRSRHVMALVNADIAPTEFLLGRIEVPDPVPGVTTYKLWDEHIESVRAGWQVGQVPDRTLIAFDCDTFHRGTAAVGNGWRWFGRISINTHRKPTNEIRRQVQVYMPTINAGW